MATSPLSSRGPTNERNCYVTPVFSGVSGKEDKIGIGNLTATFLGAHKWAELLEGARFGLVSFGKHPARGPTAALRTGDEA